MSAEKTEAQKLTELLKTYVVQSNEILKIYKELHSEKKQFNSSDGQTSVTDHINALDQATKSYWKVDLISEDLATNSRAIVTDAHIQGALTAGISLVEVLQYAKFHDQRFSNLNVVGPLRTYLKNCIVLVQYLKFEKNIDKVLKSHVQEVAETFQKTGGVILDNGDILPCILQLARLQFRWHSVKKCAEETKRSSRNACEEALNFLENNVKLEEKHAINETHWRLWQDFGSFYIEDLKYIIKCSEGFQRCMRQPNVACFFA